MSSQGSKAQQKEKKRTAQPATVQTPAKKTKKAEGDESAAKAPAGQDLQQVKAALLEGVMAGVLGQGRQFGSLKEYLKYKAALEYYIDAPEEAFPCSQAEAAAFEDAEQLKSEEPLFPAGYR